MAWYNVGTVTVTASSATVTGSGTAFLTNVRVGDGFTVAGSTNIYQITNIASDTQLTISPVFTGTAGSGKAYAIVPVQGYVKDLADQARQLILTFGTIVGNNSVTALSNVTGTAGAIPYFTSASVMSTVLQTTSMLDSTQGRITKVGDFGLGATSLLSALGYVGDLNTLYGPTGWRYASASVTNGPISSAGGYLLVEQISASYTKQTFTAMATGRQYWRVYNNGTWLGWTEIANTGNAVMRAGGNSNSISGQLVFSSTDSVIRTDTTDGSDTKRLQLGGGGLPGRNRGAYINIHGNEHATNPGMCDLLSGDPTGSAVRIFTGPNAAERARVTDIGNVLINSTTDDATNKLQVNGGTISNDIKLRNDGGIIGTNATGLMIYSGLTTDTANTTRLAIRTSANNTAGGAWIEAYGKDHTSAPGELRLGGVSALGIGAIRFYAGGYQRGMLTDAGRFLLGSSSGTDDGTNSTLQVTGQTSISTNLIISSSTTKRLRITTDSTSVYMQAGESTASTTANLFLGSSMNSTDGKLIVLGNGRIIINNTVANDDGTNRLQVNGSIKSIGDLRTTANLRFDGSTAGQTYVIQPLAVADQSVRITAGAGSTGPAAGADILLSANTAANTGKLYISAGTAVDGNIIFRSGPSNTVRGTIFDNGRWVIGSGTDDGSNLLQVNGSASVTGNINLTGTGNRITGAFGGSSQTDRVLFQTNIANSSTAVGIIPNGTGIGGNLDIFASSDPANSPYATLYTNGNGVYVAANRLGTGAYLPLMFAVGGAEKARITPNNGILFGTSTSAGLWDGSEANPGLQYDIISKTLNLQTNANSANLLFSKRGLTNPTFMGMYYLGVIVGSVSTTGSAVAYNTTSDARVKTDITPLEDTRVYVAAMNPVLHKWNTDFYPDADNTLPTAGFLASELEEVFPQAVTGKKDAVDADGKIIPQAVDLSKLIPVLTSALKAEMADNEQARQSIEELKEENRVLKLQMAAILEHLDLDIDTSAPQTEVDTAPSIEE